jgi:hypothetical protein
MAEASEYRTATPAGPGVFLRGVNDLQEEVLWLHDSLGCRLPSCDPASFTVLATVAYGGGRDRKDNGEDPQRDAEP